MNTIFQATFAVVSCLSAISAQNGLPNLPPSGRLPNLPVPSSGGSSSPFPPNNAPFASSPFHPTSSAPPNIPLSGSPFSRTPFQNGPTPSPFSPNNAPFSSSPAPSSPFSKVPLPFPLSSSNNRNSAPFPPTNTLPNTSPFYPPQASSMANSPMNPLTSPLNPQGPLTVGPQMCSIPVVAPPASNVPCVIQRSGRILTVSKVQDKYLLVVQDINGVETVTQEHMRSVQNITIKQNVVVAGGVKGVSTTIVKENSFMFTSKGMITHATSGLCMSPIPNSNQLGLVPCQNAASFKVDFAMGYYQDVKSGSYMMFDGNNVVLQQAQIQNQTVQQSSITVTPTNGQPMVIPNLPPVGARDLTQIKPPFQFTTFALSDAPQAMPAPVQGPIAVMKPLAITSSNMYMVVKQVQQQYVITTTTSPNVLQTQAWAITKEGYLMNMIFRKCVSVQPGMGPAIVECSQQNLTKFVYVQKAQQFMIQGTPNGFLLHPTGVSVMDVTQMNSTVTVLSTNTNVIKAVTVANTNMGSAFVYGDRTTASHSTVTVNSMVSISPVINNIINNINVNSTPGGNMNMPNNVNGYNTFSNVPQVINTYNIFPNSITSTPMPQPQVSPSSEVNNPNEPYALPMSDTSSDPSVDASSTSNPTPVVSGTTATVNPDPESAVEPYRIRGCHGKNRKCFLIPKSLLFGFMQAQPSQPWYQQNPYAYQTTYPMSYNMNANQFMPSQGSMFN